MNNLDLLCITEHFLKCFILRLLSLKISKPRMKQHSIKQVIALLSILMIMASVTQAQTFRPNINVDSLFAASIAWMNPVKKAEYQQLYKESDERSKDFLVFMLAMPSSSKKEMIRNIDMNYAQIAALKD